MYFLEWYVVPLANRAPSDSSATRTWAAASANSSRAEVSTATVPSRNTIVLSVVPVPLFVEGESPAELFLASSANPLFSSLVVTFSFGGGVTNEAPASLLKQTGRGEAHVSSLGAKIGAGNTLGSSRSKRASSVSLKPATVGLGKIGTKAGGGNGEAVAGAGTTGDDGNGATTSSVGSGGTG